jgi:hypothetical protein
MDNELAVIAPTSVMANSPTELRGLGAPVLGWARKKRDEARAEHDELMAAATEAKKHKWKTSTLNRAASKALLRVTFYDKCAAALEGGYILFPPVPNADVIAIRTTEECGYFEERTKSWRGAPEMKEEKSDSPPIGEGEYKSPWIGWHLVRRFTDEKGNEQSSWMTVSDLKDAEFPLVMAKPQIIAATNAAMELRVFDEIRLFPFEKRRGDPCILGAIIDRSGFSERRHYFLISWLIREQDI